MECLGLAFLNDYLSVIVCLIIIVGYYVGFKIFTQKKPKESEEKITGDMIDETIETLAFTIDAKDRYTKGHSSRVAKYARMIAQVHGKSEEECNQVYRAALLHDIGKIAVPGSIINKPDLLTDSELDNIMFHPERGAKILAKMKSLPYLQDAAKYHHERYDGTGYPCRLKGEEIPELARIIAVADAYDAMTSGRSYRRAMDQSVVKQELWKGMGTQFDPHFAKIMISLIDSDSEYDLREKPYEEDEINFDYDFKEIVWPSATPRNINEEEGIDPDANYNSLGAFVCGEDHWCTPTEGIKIDETPGTVSFVSKCRPDAKYVWNTPVALVYSSDDGRIMGPNYDELEINISAGYGWRTGSSTNRSSDFTKLSKFISWDNWFEANKNGLAYTATYRIEKNVVYLEFGSELLVYKSQVEVPKNYNRPIYIAFSADRCDISEFKIEK